MASITSSQRKKLRAIFQELFPTEDSSRAILDSANIPVSNIKFSSASKINWFYIVKEVEMRKMLITLGLEVLDEFPERGDLKLLIKEIQDNSERIDEIEKTLSTIKIINESGQIDLALEVLKAITQPGDNEWDLTSKPGTYYYLLNNVVSRYQKNELPYLEAVAKLGDLKHEINLYIDELPNLLKSKGQNIVPFLKGKDFVSSSQNIQDIFTHQDFQFVKPSWEGEKVIGNIDHLVQVSWFCKGLRASQCVCRIARKDNNRTVGTGFLLKGGFLITNNHVIEDRHNLRKLFAEFSSFEYSLLSQNKGKEIRPLIEKYNFDTTTWLTSPMANHNSPIPGFYDYAIVKLVNNKIPISKWGFLEVEDFSFYKPQNGYPANIIQHPIGREKSFTVTSNEIVGTWNHYLFYVADTLNGASGAPVLNEDWKVIALHHAGKTDDGGFPINKTGIKRKTNRGILLPYIFDDLRKSQNIDQLSFLNKE